MRGALAFGAPVGVRGAGEEAGCLTVHDDEGRLVRHGHLAGLHRVEVDVERVAGAGAGDGQGIEQTDVGARAALGLLAVEGQGQGIGVVAQREEQGHGKGGTRGEAGTDRQGAGDPDHPARRWVLGAQEPGRQGGLGAHRFGVAQHDLEGGLRELVRVDPEEEAAGLGREVDLRGQLYGHGERTPGVVIGVVADDGHSARGAGGRHVPSLAQGRGGLDHRGHNGSASCDGRPHWTAERDQDH